MNKIIEGAKEALAVAQGNAPAARVYSTTGPVCPYCQRQFVADDAWYFDEYRCTKDECDECGREFRIRVTHSVSWSCTPID